MTIKSAIINNAGIAKANAMQWASAAKQYGQYAYSQSTAVYTQYKEFFQSNRNFAIAHLFVVNLAAYKIIGNVSNFFSEKIPAQSEISHQIKQISFTTFFAASIYKVNQTFCQYTGLVVSNHSLKAVAIAAALYRLINNDNILLKSLIEGLYRNINILANDAIVNFNDVRKKMDDANQAFTASLAAQKSESKDAQRNLAAVITTLEERLEKLEKDKVDSEQINRIVLSFESQIKMIDELNDKIKALETNSVTQKELRGTCSILRLQRNSLIGQVGGGIPNLPQKPLKDDVGHPPLESNSDSDDDSSHDAVFHPGSNGDDEKKLIT